MKIITSADGTKKHLFLKIHNEKTENYIELFEQLERVQDFITNRYFPKKTKPDNLDLDFSYVDDDFLNNKITLRFTFNQKQ